MESLTKIDTEEMSCLMACPKKRNEERKQKRRLEDKAKGKKALTQMSRIPIFGKISIQLDCMLRNQMQFTGKRIQIPNNALKFIEQIPMLFPKLFMLLLMMRVRFSECFNLIRNAIINNVPFPFSIQTKCSVSYLHVQGIHESQDRNYPFRS